MLYPLKARLKQWRKVGTKENPADDVSRGFSGFGMVSSDSWKRGPEFIWQEEPAWPTNPVVPEIASDDKELKNQVKCCDADVQRGEEDVRYSMCRRPKCNNRP